MKKLTSLFSIVALFALTSLGAGFVSEVADGSPAIRVYNGSDTDSLTINIYEAGDNTTNSIIVGSTSTVIDGVNTAFYIEDWTSEIGSATNSAGATVLRIDSDCSLGTDTASAYLLTGAYTAAAGEWLEIPWDTSACKFYSLYVPDQSVDPNRTDLTIDKIFGNPAGTGTVTISIYVDGTLTWGKLMPEVYAYSNNTASVDLPIDVDLPVMYKSVIIRATRATTATTGNLGVTVE